MQAYVWISSYAQVRAQLGNHAMGCSSRRLKVAAPAAGQHPHNAARTNVRERVYLAVHIRQDLPTRVVQEAESTGLLRHCHACREAHDTE